MRRRLALFGAGMTLAMLVSFLVPLAQFIRNVAADRAVGSAQQDAQTIAVVAARGGADLANVVDQINSGGGHQATVFLPDGSTVGAAVAASPAVRLAQRQSTAFTADSAQGREVLVPVIAGSGQSVVRVFVPKAELTHGVRSSFLLLGVIAAALVVIALTAAFLVARTMSRPVVAVARAAHRLASGDLEARVVPAGPPEVVEVGRALNRLAERITQLLAAERELIADLSHRLRTPVTALRLDIDGLRDPEEAARVGGHLDALQRSVDEIIRAARRPVRTALPRCDAAAVVRGRVQFWEVLAEDQGRDLRLSVGPGEVAVPVDGDELAAAVDVLIENVFSHTPEGSGFSVLVRHRQDWADVIVSDQGPGIADPALLTRGTSGGGSTGLGLDIARRCALSAGGRFRIGRNDGGGAEIVLELPVVPS